MCLWTDSPFHLINLVYCLADWGSSDNGSSCESNIHLYHYYRYFQTTWRPCSMFYPRGRLASSFYSRFPSWLPYNTAPRTVSMFQPCASTEPFYLLFKIVLFYIEESLWKFLIGCEWSKSPLGSSIISCVSQARGSGLHPSSVVWATAATAVVEHGDTAHAAGSGSKPSPGQSTIPG